MNGPYPAQIPDKVPEFTVTKTIAESTIHADGSMGKQGEHMNRLALQENVNTRVSIAAVEVMEGQKPPIPWYKKAQFVQYQLGDKTYLLNINSMRKRLHLSEKEIRAASEAGSLSSLMATRMEEITRLYEDYDKVLTQFTEGSDYLNTHEGKNKDFTHKTLLKVVLAAYQHTAPEGSAAVLLLNSHKFVVTKENSGTQLALVSKKLGEGTFGAAYEAVNVTTGEARVLKQALDRDNAKLDVQREFAMLKKINVDQDGNKAKIGGIQESGHSFIQVTRKISSSRNPFSRLFSSPRPIIGYLGPRYETHYRAKIVERGKIAVQNQNMKEFDTQCFEEGHGLLFGLKELVARKVGHGDIKTENVFWKTAPDGSPVADIADFGGATDLSATSITPNTTYTPRFVSKKDLDSMEQLEEEHQRSAGLVSYFEKQLEDANEQLRKAQTGGNQQRKQIKIRKIEGSIEKLKSQIAEEKKIRDAKREELIELYEKRDVFAMGCVLAMAYNYAAPFQKYGKDAPPNSRPYPDFTSGLNLRADIPEDLARLFTEMLHIDPEQRPTAQRAFERYDAFLAKQNPGLHQKLQA